MKLSSSYSIILASAWWPPQPRPLSMGCSLTRRRRRQPCGQTVKDDAPQTNKHLSIRLSIRFALTKGLSACAVGVSRVLLVDCGLRSFMRMNWPNWKLHSTLGGQLQHFNIFRIACKLPIANWQSHNKFCHNATFKLFCLSLHFNCNLNSFSFIENTFVLYFP